MLRDGLQVEVYRGLGASAPLWDGEWSSRSPGCTASPKPIGIIAVTDARARQLLQACLTAGIAVPERVALIGIDNDPLTRTLTRVPLSSVIPGHRNHGSHCRCAVAPDVARQALRRYANPRAAGRDRRSGLPAFINPWAIRT